MEKEQIIKALKCCCGMLPCIECPYTEIEECAKQNTKDVIALIKELTEENERLKNICNSYALQYGTARDKEVFLRKEREYTVREMQDRLNLRIKDKLAYHGWYLTDTLIPTIVEEMLNKNTEDEEK